MATIQSTFGRPAVSISGEATAAEAASLMFERGVGALVVTDASGQASGVVGERELIWGVLAPCRDACSVQVAELTTRAVPRVGPLADPKLCSELMRRNGLRHLLVEEAGEVLGVVSMRDVIRALLDESEAHVRDLTAYVTGGQA